LAGHSGACPCVFDFDGGLGGSLGVAGQRRKNAQAAQKKAQHAAGGGVKSALDSGWVLGCVHCFNKWFGDSKGIK
jgi:hypothetical protein